MKAILVSDLQTKARHLRSDIRVESNNKIKARLIEEEAAIKLVLRNFKQHVVRIDTIPPKGLKL